MGYPDLSRYSELKKEGQTDGVVCSEQRFGSELRRRGFKSLFGHRNVQGWGGNEGRGSLLSYTSNRLPGPDNLDRTLTITTKQGLVGIR